MFKPAEKDINQPVTKGEFGGFADFVKEFIDFVKENVALKKDVEALSLRTEVKLEAVEARLEKNMSEKFDKVMISNDTISKKLDIVLTKQAATNGNVDQYRDEVKGHEKRIGRLEAHAGIQ